MATYEVSDPQSGKTLELTGDSPPTEQELEEIFAKVNGGDTPPPPAATANQPLTLGFGGKTATLPETVTAPITEAVKGAGKAALATLGLNRLPQPSPQLFDPNTGEGMGPLAQAAIPETLQAAVGLPAAAIGKASSAIRSGLEGAIPAAEQALGLPEGMVQNQDYPLPAVQFGGQRVSLLPPLSVAGVRIASEDPISMQRMFTETTDLVAQIAFFDALGRGAGKLTQLAGKTIAEEAAARRLAILEAQAKAGAVSQEAVAEVNKRLMELRAEPSRLQGLAAAEEGVRYQNALEAMDRFSGPTEPLTQESRVNLSQLRDFYKDRLEKLKAEPSRLTNLLRVEAELQQEYVLKRILEGNLSFEERMSFGVAPGQEAAPLSQREIVARRLGMAPERAVPVSTPEVMGIPERPTSPPLIPGRAYEPIDRAGMLRAGMSEAPPPRPVIPEGAPAPAPIAPSIPERPAVSVPPNVPQPVPAPTPALSAPETMARAVAAQSRHALKEGFQKASDALEAVNPYLTNDLFLGFVAENIAKRAGVTAEQLGTVVPAIEDKIIPQLASGNRFLQNFAKKLTTDLIPEKAQKSLARIAGTRNQSMLLKSAVNVHGSEFIGRPVLTAADSIEAVRAIAQSLEKGNRFVRGMLKTIANDIPQGIGYGWKQVPERVVAAASEFKEITHAQSLLTNLTHLSNVIDRKRAVFTDVTYPVFQASNRSVQGHISFMDAWEKKFPGIISGKRSSEVLSRFIENKLQPGDFKAVTPAIREAAKYSRNAYNQFLTGVNRVNMAIGKPPIPFRQNYMAHGRELSYLQSLFGNNMQNITAEMLSASTFGKPNSPFFRHALKRMGGAYTEDAVGALFNYVRGASAVIELTGPVQRMRATAKLMPPIAQRAYETMAINVLANKNVLGIVDEIAKAPLFRFLADTKNRIVRNLVGGNLQTLLVQSGSIPAITTKIGQKNFLMAIVDAASPEKYALAVKNSVAVQAARHVIDSETGLASKFIKAVGIPLEKVNEIVSVVSYLGGLRKAAQMELTGVDAMAFGDEVANASNVIYIKGNKPLILQSRFVNTFFPLQTFTLNAYNFLRYDIVPAGDTSFASRLVSKEAMTNAANFATTAAILDGLFMAANVRAPVGPTDFLPFVGAMRSGAGIGPVLDLMHSAGSGMSSLVSGDTKAAKREAEKILFRVVPPTGGVQLQRLLQGRVLSTQKKKRNALP